MMQGEFKNNKISGIGTMRDNKGVKVYEGEWLENLKHGVGTFAEKGVLYSGGFVKDKKHGKGVMKNISTGVEIQGEWVEDVLQNPSKQANSL